MGSPSSVLGGVTVPDIPWSAAVESAWAAVRVWWREAVIEDSEVVGESSSWMGQFVAEKRGGSSDICVDNVSEN